jgi:DNA-binding response OmpR family regulator
MCHVLVIEDEPLIAEMICDFLEAEGATSFSVAASEDAAREMADRQVPTVITSDVRLAKGYGPRAVEAIRAIHGEVPTIFITALPDECKPCDHAIAIIQKPFTARQLTGAFAKAWAASPNA